MKPTARKNGVPRCWCWDQSLLEGPPRPSSRVPSWPSQPSCPQPSSPRPLKPIPGRYRRAGEHPQRPNQHSSYCPFAVCEEGRSATARSSCSLGRLRALRACQGKRCWTGSQGPLLARAGATGPQGQSHKGHKGQPVADVKLYAGAQDDHANRAQDYR